MKGQKYRFKYLLYKSPAARFTLREAEILARDRSEQDLLFRDLATRSAAYRRKVEKNLKKYEEVLAM